MADIFLASTPPFDAEINADPQRQKDYINLKSMLRNWDVELTEMDAYFRHADTEEEAEEFEYASHRIPVKKSIAINNYANIYAKFKLFDDVQVIENNRVLYLGQIRRVVVALSFKDIEKARNIQPRDIQFVHQTDTIYHIENEFIYIIYSHSNTISKSGYNKRSPRIIMKVPRVMHRFCPVCITYDKPLIDTVIGKADKVICPDCNQLLRDMFGDDYVTNTMKFDTISDLPEYDRIWKISSNL